MENIIDPNHCGSRVVCKNRFTIREIKNISSIGCYCDIDFPTMAEARDYLIKDLFSKNEESNTVYIIIKQGATDLTNSSTSRIIVRDELRRELYAQRFRL